MKVHKKGLKNQSTFWKGMEKKVGNEAVGCLAKAVLKVAEIQSRGQTFMSV